MNILKLANEIVNNRTEEKDRKYGPFTEGMKKVASMASLMGNKQLDCADAFNVLIALKLSRESYNHKEDNLLDAAAYIGGLNNYHNEMTFAPVVRNIDKNVKFNIFKDIWDKGDMIEVRGLKTKELINYSFELDPYDRFFNFKGRKFNLDYLKKELKWYFKADKEDYSIAKHAKIWRDILEADGHINSNYGAIIFGSSEVNRSNFERIIYTLNNDKYSRKAVILIANNEVFENEETDCQCTLSMVFCIRNDKLHLTVNMRSNDAIYGLANDIPFFTIVQEMVYWKLKDKYPELQMGRYYHQVNSLHVYERHFKMLQSILENAQEDPVEWPTLSSSEEVDTVLSYYQSDIGLDENEYTKFLDN
mgnify:CR=1 FL=1